MRLQCGREVAFMVRSGNAHKAIGYPHLPRILAWRDMSCFVWVLYSRTERGLHKGSGSCTDSAATALRPFGLVLVILPFLIPGS